MGRRLLLATLALFSTVAMANQAHASEIRTVTPVADSYVSSSSPSSSYGEVRNDDTFGVLKLKLHPSSYEWEFMPQSGKTFKDYGSRSCH